MDLRCSALILLPFFFFFAGTIGISAVFERSFFDLVAKLLIEAFAGLYLRLHR